MQGLLGVILGIALTIAVAFAYDTGTGRAANGLQPSAADGNAPMVNWDVVRSNWHGWSSDVRNTWHRLASR